MEVHMRCVATIVLTLGLAVAWGCTPSSGDSGDSGDLDPGMGMIENLHPEDSGGKLPTDDGRDPVDASVEDVGGREPVEASVDAEATGVDPIAESGTNTPRDTTEDADAKPEPFSLLCRPCSADVDCDSSGLAANGNRCVDRGVLGRYCGAACASDEGCPEGHACADTADGSRQCQPAAGATCPCPAENQDIVMPCARENGAGRCAGAMTCSAECSAKEPQAEACNGIDDDCDGSVDEGDPGGGIACKTMLPGACAAGTTTCKGGGVTCVQDAQPSQELCNGVDDDCSSVIDDVPGSGTPCPNEVPGHIPPWNCTGTWQCDDTQGTRGVVCNARTPVAETCNGTDDNCNGTVDEGDPGGGIACNTMLPGACAAGTSACQAGSVACVQDALSAAELCNGIDDDCDGSADNGDPGGGLACNTGLLGACTSGTTACQAGSVACVPHAQPVDEACNGVDDDCDGSADNGDPGGGLACDTGLPGACAAGTTACQGGGAACLQGSSATAELCNGIDDDCDGTMDNGNPGGGLACDTALPGPCAPGTTACQAGGTACVQHVLASEEACNGIDDDCSGIIDDVPGVGTACSNTIPGYTPPWSCVGTWLCLVQGGTWGVECSAVTPVAETCNGTDDNCDGTVDDGDPCADNIACTADACAGSAGCTNMLLAGFCRIGNACWSEGQVNPANPCEACATAVRTTEWTPVVGTCPPLEGYGVSCNPLGRCEYASLDTAGWRLWDVWIWVPAGSFLMGSPQDEAGHLADEAPVHPVTLSAGFLIGKYELAVATYEACRAAVPAACTPPSSSEWDAAGWGTNSPAGGREFHAQNGLTWTQAGAACGWLAGRLPTEAEWEYAAKGPTHRKYPWGDVPEPSCENGTAVFDDGGDLVRPWGCDPCTLFGCSGTALIGTKAAGGSWSGALDMSGNVWEWCQDWWHPDYVGALGDGSAALDPPGTLRAVRGGSFYSASGYLRTSARFGEDPAVGRYAGIGARCVRSVP